MNCPDYERWIALHVGDDLAPTETAWLEAHLAECAECRAFAEDLRTSREELKGLRDALLPEGSLVALRARVLPEVAMRRRRRRLWWQAAAATALLAAGIAGLLQSRRTTVPPPEVAVTRPAAPAAEQQKMAEPPKPAELSTIDERRQTGVAAKPSPRPVRRAPTREEPPLLARNTEPTVVKLLTDDPDVVIIWLIEEKENENEKAGSGLDGPRGD